MALTSPGGGTDAGWAENPFWEQTARQQEQQSQPDPRVASPAQASRFLNQATNGATIADISTLMNRGIDGWLAGQFAMPRSQSHWRWLDSLGDARDPVKYDRNRGFVLWDSSIWRQLITAPDQLRQRVALALLDTMVVSVNELATYWPHYAMAAYMDVLLDHAFGNFRDLMGAITTNAAMATYLTFLNSTKSTGGSAGPDENYARELMQLFTLGVYELNLDGSLRRGADGQPIETYSQDDVSQLARVFTGLRMTTPHRYRPEAWRERLVIDPERNETGPSTFLGRTVSGGGMRAIDQALDVIFEHPNMPPFISTTLIRRLVSSNPSPGYISRVARVFIDNGSGGRGDMKAVTRAILTDAEARSEGGLTAPHTGKLRDPIQRLTQWARASGATSRSGRWTFGDLSRSTGLGQSPGRAPSVFNFFRPGYSPPNSELSRRGLVSPEMQITDEQSTIGYMNYMQGVIANGAGGGDIRPNYSAFLRNAGDSRALVDGLNMLLAAGQLSPSSVELIRSAVDSIWTGTQSQDLRRLQTAIYLTMMAPEYLVLK